MSITIHDNDDLMETFFPQLSFHVRVLFSFIRHSRPALGKHKEIP